MRTWSAVAVGFLLVVIAARAAAADEGPSVYYSLRFDEKHKQGTPPNVDVLVVGGPNGVPASSWSLAQVDVHPPVVIPAIDLRTHVHDRDNLAIALVVEGHKIFVGNDEYEKNPDDRWSGVFSILKDVLSEISKADPIPTSEVMVVVYGRGARVLAPLRPLTALSPTVFGRQSDYENEVARDLAQGVALAMDGLGSTTAARKALIVIGDGADTNVDSGPARLIELRKRAERDRIELYAINYNAGIGDELFAIKRLVDKPFIVGGVDEIVPATRAVVERINDRFVLTFHPSPSWFDNCPHDFQLLLDGKPFPNEEPTTWELLLYFHGPRCAAKAKPDRDESNWAWLLVFTVGIAAAVGTAAFLRRRRTERPQRS